MDRHRHFFPFHHLVKMPNQQPKHYLSTRYGYRCIWPNHQTQGLDCFYGSDRSFCMGLMFDDTDFVVEFGPRSGSDLGLEPVSHHDSAYRGSLTRENTTISAVYFRKIPIDYPKRIFFKYLKKIYRHVPVGTSFYQYTSSDRSDLVFLKSVWKKI